MKTYKIPVIAGDGIGPEVIAEGKKVLEAAGENYGFNIEWKEYPFGAEHYLSTGELITEDALKELSNYDAIYLGSVGDARVPSGVLELSLIHISEPTRLGMISYAVFCLKKKKRRSQKAY